MVLDTTYSSKLVCSNTITILQNYKIAILQQITITLQYYNVTIVVAGHHHSLHYLPRQVHGHQRNHSKPFPKRTQTLLYMASYDYTRKNSTWWH